MNTWKRICKEDQSVSGCIDDEIVKVELKKDKEYITSEIKEGRIWVFTNYWLSDIPAEWFLEGEVYTQDKGDQ